MAISEVIRLHARFRPDKDAIVAGERRISYRSLDRRVNSACLAVAAAGVGYGNLIGVALGDSAEHLMMLLALARVGAVIVPMDHRWSEDEKSAVAASFRVSRILVDAGDARPASLRLPIRDEWFAESDKEYVEPRVTPDSPLLLSLSSGTTGKPKGPRVTHQQFENRFMAYWINVGLSSYDRYIAATPLYFGGGRGFSWAMLFCGATVFMLPPPYKPEELIAYVAAVRGTAIFLVPTLVRRLIEVHAGDLALPTVQRLICSGSALYPEERLAIRQRLTPGLIEMYSSTEGGAVSVLGPEDVESHADSIGRPCFRVQVEVVDEQHRPLPPGEAGRLRYRSPASALSYFAADSSEAFRDGWYYPGDLASIGSDGFLYLRGRVKDMIIRGGVNIYPGDIEQVLMQSGKISETAVIGVPSPQLGEEVVAFVVRSSPIEEADLISICRARLAAYKVPRRIIFAADLPRNSSGKILKTELAARVPPL